MGKGKLVLFSGPSGAGKSTIVKHLLDNKSYGLNFSISATSRKKREGEIDGEHYLFMSIDEFKSKIEEDQFLEWEEVYANHYYGTLRNSVENMLNDGKNIIFDIDVMGAINIKRQYKDEAISIFVNPPSLEVLEERLKGRNTDSEENVKKRLRKARMELNYARRFDHKIENVDLDKTLEEADQLVSSFLS